MRNMCSDEGYGQPFILRFLEPLDPGDYAESIADHELAVRTYSAQTQTSAVSMAGGTSRTYSGTFSGLFGNRDDDKVTDS